MILIPIRSLNVEKVERTMPSKLAEPCLLCGRPLYPEAPPTSGGRGVQFMEITTDGEIVWPGDGTMASVPNSQGGFPVGADCFRKIKAAGDHLQYVADMVKAGVRDYEDRRKL